MLPQDAPRCRAHETLLSLTRFFEALVRLQIQPDEDNLRQALAAGKPVTGHMSVTNASQPGATDFIRERLLSDPTTG